MIDNIKKKFSSLDKHTAEVVKNSSSATLVNIVGMAFGLFISIYLGQALGVEGFGVISLAIKIAAVVLILCLLGMKQVIVKEVAIGHEKSSWQYIRNVIFSSFIVNGGITVVVVVGLIFLAPVLANTVFNEPRLEMPLIIIAIGIVPHIVSTIFSSALVGINKIWQGNLIDQTLSYILIGTLLLVLWLTSFEITILQVAIIFVAGRLLVALGSGLYYAQILSSNSAPSSRKFIGPELLKTSLPLLIVGASSIIASNADSIMVGWLDNSHQVGLYVVAARVALLTSFFLQVTNSAISPKIAALYSKGETAEMEIMVQRITSILVVIAIIPISIFLLFGDVLLSIWGNEFAEAYWILIVLSVGQFFNLSTGAAGLTLMLCGEERTQGTISITFVILNLLLNYVFIIHYGALGAAFATSITVTAENITKVVLVKKKIGILTIPNRFKS